MSLKINVDDTVPRKIRGDETRLRQILLNLLSNAIKFTKSGDVSLFVSTHSIDPEFNSVELNLRCEILVSECRMISRLFMPFSQGDSSTTRKYGGTGLGLAICKSLSEAMGGKVWATSVLRKALVFVESGLILMK